jgi:hypothetical protein
MHPAFNLLVRKGEICKNSFLLKNASSDHTKQTSWQLAAGSQMAE